jgi:hypothetical protein
MFGIEADHRRSSWAGSKSAATGGRWLWSMPKPLALWDCSCLWGRTSMWSPTN